MSLEPHVEWLEISMQRTVCRDSLLWAVQLSDGSLVSALDLESIALCVLYKSMQRFIILSEQKIITFSQGWWHFWKAAEGCWGPILFFFVSSPGS